MQKQPSSRDATFKLSIGSKTNIDNPEKQRRECCWGPSHQYPLQIGCELYMYLEADNVAELLDRDQGGYGNLVLCSIYIHPNQAIQCAFS